MTLTTAVRGAFGTGHAVGKRFERAIDIQGRYKIWVYKKDIDSRINDDR